MTTTGTDTQVEETDGGRRVAVRPPPAAAGQPPPTGQPARATTRGAGLRTGAWRWVAGLVLPLALLVAWQVAASSGSFPRSQLPPPADVVAVLPQLRERGTLWLNIAASLQRVLVGFAIGAGLGLLVGVLVGLSGAARALLTPSIETLRAVPSLAWVPLLILWMGIYEGPKITLVAIGAFFPVFTTVVSGLDNVDRNLVEVGRAYGLRGPTLAARILLPAAAPAVLSGLRLGLAQAWLFLVAAELIASSQGLGFLLVDGQNTGRTDQVLLAIIMLALLGKASDVALGLAQRRVLRWAR